MDTTIPETVGEPRKIPNQKCDLLRQVFMSGECKWAITWCGNHRADDRHGGSKLTIETAIIGVGGNRPQAAGAVQQH